MGIRHWSFAVLLSLTACATPPPATPPTPAPEHQPPTTDRRLPLSPYAGWKSAITLSNDHLRVTVVPAIGRIMEIRPAAGGDNLLNNAPALLGKRLARKDTFTNFGGDWLWPVAQSHWTNLAPTDWPPPPALADGAWDAEATRQPDGRQTCLLLRRYGPPLNLIVTRLIALDPASPRIRIQQRALCLGPCAVPVTLWQVAQVGGAARVYVPAYPHHDDGIRPLKPPAPSPERLTRLNDAIAFDALGDGEFKFGAGSDSAWIAAHRGDQALLIRETGAAPTDSPRPDGGCAVEVYANAGLGYVEIETLAPERRLQPGDSIENTLTIEPLALPAELPPADAIRALKQVLTWP